MIEDLLVHLGVEDIRPLGSEVQARCPRHEERTGHREYRPDNWSINRSTGKHHCFSCGYSGDLTRLIMDLSKVGLWDAHGLKHRFDVELEPLEGEPVWKPVTPTSTEALGQFGLPPARAMARRRLTPESVKRFGIQWDSEESAWVLPIKGPTGEMWGWQTKSPTRILNHPPGIRKSKTLFGLDVLHSTAAVLVESPLDACYLDSLGIPALAAFGCQVSDVQMHLVIERLDEVTLALDNDSAGLRETRRLVKEGWHHRIRMSIFSYDKVMQAKDPGELSSRQIERGIHDANLAALW